VRSTASSGWKITPLENSGKRTYSAGDLPHDSHSSNALAHEVEKPLGEESLRRFIPYAQMYEFEGLLFSRPQAFSILSPNSDLVSRLQWIRDQFASPEAINDDVETAPSKRLLSLIDGYEKPFHGALVALETGPPVIRCECPIFDTWLQRIESLN